MKILKALLFVCISFSTFSQKNYTRGFIILKNQTDTLKGQIDDQNWAINPRAINFKTNEGSEQTYDIDQLKAFGIPYKESYVVAKVDLDVTPVAKRNLLFGRNLQIRKDTIMAFLVLLKADYNLLYLRDQTDKDHFFYTDGAEVIELINHIFLESKGGKTYELNNKNYQKQLEMLFNRCEKKIRTDNIGYQLNELTDKFIEFSECIGCNYTCYVKKQKDNVVFTFGVMAGLNSDRNSLFYESVFDNVNFSKKIKAPNEMFGINASISSRRNLNRNSFLLESYITREKIKKEFGIFSANMYYLNVSPRIRHQFISMRQINPFVGGGINAKYFMYYPSEVDIYGARFNYFLMGEAGLKWNNFLLSAGAKLIILNNRRNVSEDLLIINYNGSQTIRQTIHPEKVNFQVSLTYLLYNSANSRKTKK